MSVHRTLEHDPSAQRKLEALYKMCMRDLLSHGRIHDLILKHVCIATKMYEDFKQIHVGKCKPHFNTEIEKEIDSKFTDAQDRQILKMFLTFNESCLMTNFFKPDTPG